MRECTWRGTSRPVAVADEDVGATFEELYAALPASSSAPTRQPATTDPMAGHTYAADTAGCGRKTARTQPSSLSLNSW